MPTSATGPCTNRLGRAGSGFTLVELLVVLIVIAVMAGSVRLAFTQNGHERLLEQEATRLAALMTLAEQESLLRGTALGLQLFEHGYRFLIFSEQGWQAELNDNLFRSRWMEPRISLGLIRDGVPWPLSKAENQAAPSTPDVVFTTEGVVHATELTLAVDQHQFSIAASDAEGWRVVEREQSK